MHNWANWPGVITSFKAHLDPSDLYTCTAVQSKPMQLAFGFKELLDRLMFLQPDKSHGKVWRVQYGSISMGDMDHMKSGGFNAC